MSKPVILTGLRANNDLHIGNYFGALLPLVDMAVNHADKYEINLFVPDLHSFTTPIDHLQLYEQILHNLKIFVAAGLPLDDENIRIYRQSYVPAHSELTWILDCFTQMGALSRMTQFKDKTSLYADERRQIFQKSFDEMIKAFADGLIDREEIVRRANQLGRRTIESFETARYAKASVGLFNYPVLMAADILLYGAEYVPVGEDQSQHLEFALDLAKSMNIAFPNIFPKLPKPVNEQHKFFGKDQGLRIKDLVDPTKKMSKSDEHGKGVIFLGDDPEKAADKIKAATTDSLGNIDPYNEDQAGIRNLIQILALIRGEAYDDVAKQYAGEPLYGSLKTAVAQAVGTFLDEFQQRLAGVDEHQLLQKLERDEKAMNEIANATLYKVQKAVGLRA